MAHYHYSVVFVPPVGIELRVFSALRRVRYWLCHYPILSALIGIAFNCCSLGALVLFSVLLRAIARRARAAPARPGDDLEADWEELPAADELPLQPPPPLRVENAHELLNALPPEAYDLPPPHQPRPIGAAADQMLLERQAAHAPPDGDDDELEFRDALSDDERAVPEAAREGLRRRAPAAAASATSSASTSTRPLSPALSPLQGSTAASPRVVHNVPSLTSAQKSRRSSSLDRLYTDLT